MQRIIRIGLILLLTLLLVLPASVNSRDLANQPAPRIINGVLTADFPAVGALLNNTGLGFLNCSMMLIGCNTAMTTAHCVCRSDEDGNENGIDCQPGGDLHIPPGDRQVFLQHAGPFDITSIDVPESFKFNFPDDDFDVANDVAILHLATPVTGIAPVRINDIARPAFGTQATAVGFGLSDPPAIFDAGLKRRGQVTTSECETTPLNPDPNSEFLCYQFTTPIGEPGSNVGPCAGDSGGPLFIDSPSGSVAAGISSFGDDEFCAPDTISAFHTDIFVEMDFIKNQAGDDLGHQACGDVSLSSSTVTGDLAEGTADQFVTAVEVPAGTAQLRVGLNGGDSPDFQNLSDFNLYVKAGSPPTTEDFDCSSERPSTFEYCEIDDPAAGTWHILVDRVAEFGTFQLTTSLVNDVLKTPGMNNVSSNANIVDENGIVVGFIVNSGPVRVALTGESNPALGTPIPDALIDLLDIATGETLASNDDCSSDPDMQMEVTDTIGRPLGAATDACLMVTLNNGLYGVRLKDVAGGSGFGLAGATQKQ